MLGLVCEWPLNARAIHTQLQRLIIYFISRSLSPRSVLSITPHLMRPLSAPFFYFRCLGDTAPSHFRRQKYSKKKRPTKMGLIFIQIITKINTKWLNYAICIITNYYTIADCAPDKNLVRRTHIYLPQTD